MSSLALLSEASRIVANDLAPADVVAEIRARQPDPERAAAELVLRYADVVADDDLDEALWLISVVRAAGREDVIDELAWLLVNLLQEEASRLRSLPDPA